uniref:Uncharacterized protein n=1 Tax=Aegilops tauschii subsp. strangulata TaxID=200361 RepID=A0A453LAP1_AEGTS
MLNAAFSDHRRLLDKLVLYGLVELKFRALSDQFYRTREHHRFVRQQVVNQQSHMYKKQSASVHARALKKVAMFGFSSRMSVTI